MLLLHEKGDKRSNLKPWLAQLLIWGFFSSFETLLTAAFVIYPLHHRLDAAPRLTFPIATLPPP